MYSGAPTTDGGAQLIIGLRLNLTSVKQHTEMCSCYHCMLIQSIVFIFFLIFSGFSVRFCMKLCKFSQFDRSASSIRGWDEVISEVPMRQFMQTPSLYSILSWTFSQ